MNKDNLFISCSKCEMGLYLYTNPITVLSNSEYTQTPINICVPDCPSMNPHTVNSNELGICVYLGDHCVAGNSEVGCLECGVECNFSRLLLDGYALTDSYEVIQDNLLFTATYESGWTGDVCSKCYH